MSARELDIRWPIGLLFLVLGVLLGLYGAVSPQLTHIAGRPDVNLNLVWGAAMTLFGLLMTGGAHRAGRRAAAERGPRGTARPPR